MKESIIGSYTYLFEGQAEFKEVITGVIESAAPKVVVGGLSYGNTYTGGSSTTYTGGSAFTGGS
jgi:hypothetical protein